jgi:mxaA protein
MSRWPGLLFCIALLGGVTTLAAQPTLRPIEPRAFGWQIGDLLERDLELNLPPGYRLDVESLPAAGVPGGAIELRRLEHEGAANAARQWLRLHYQVMSAAAQPRLHELPVVRLRVLGPSADPTVIDLRADALPVLVAPLTPLDAPARQGLGELRPDRPTPRVPTTIERRVLIACAGLAGLLLAWLLLWPAVAAWLGRRQLPFAEAERAVRLALRAGDGPPQREAAMRALHHAFNADAGRVLLPQDALAHARNSAALMNLADEVGAFFEASSRHFFGSAASVAPEFSAGDLRALARRLRMAEGDGAMRP